MHIPPDLHIFGIRHHGPGSAHALLEALTALQPDIVLAEGPTDANHLLHWLTHADMEPPVALLVYDPDNPNKAGIFPFAHFSPEYQALRYALQRGIPARFFDLPHAHRLAMEGGGLPDSTPLNQLGKASGHRSYEAWWNVLVEQRHNRTDLFESVFWLLDQVRSEAEKDADPEQNLFIYQREAHMRQAIRQARREGHKQIAVVCGAWHAPALVDFEDEATDLALITNLPKANVTCAWMPWTYSRLSYFTGYGAGIKSPGWYQHLWQMRVDGATPTTGNIHWLTRVAELLREGDFDASAAHIIEAVRLAEALAALRDLPHPSLPELNEATQTILCHGDPFPLQTIQRKMIVGERMGTIPPDTPLVPLQRDLIREQRRLKLRPDPEKSTLNLDLRNETHLDRSRLLHRLNLLGIEWGKTVQTRGQQGTYREVWRLLWQPEFTIRLIERSVYGNTVVEAVTNFVRESAETTPDLTHLTKLLDDVIVADLPDALEYIMQRIDERAALSSDIPLLIKALPPLAQVLRYGNVRQTDRTMVQRVVDSLVTRICVGLPSTCAALDESGSAEMVDLLNKMNNTVNLLDQPAHREQWERVLRQLVDHDQVHTLLTGRVCRLLLDGRLISAESARNKMQLALAVQAVYRHDFGRLQQSAFWLEGFLKNSGLTIIHDQQIWQLLDQWVQALDKEHFLNIVPLLRRTFASFSEATRQQIREKLRASRATKITPDTANFDRHRARKVLPFLEKLLVGHVSNVTTEEVTYNT